ncbi:MAG: hypothetical protein FWC21_03570 [Treponema sp.]|nr:hypothetical protein [Treponema sp.]
MIKGIQPLSDLPARKTDTIKQKSSVQAPEGSAQLKNILRHSPAAASLPQNKLSSAIFSFARFFSLPLKPSLLADIRRSALQLPPASVFNEAASSVKTAAIQNDQTAKSSADIKTAGETKTRDTSSELTARALAAAAAESKGTELSQKGLESYAYVIDPPSRRQDGERKKRGQEHNQQELELNKKKSEKNRGGGSDPENDEIKNLFAERLKKLFLENAERPAVSDTLNALPGKNGQRWIVLPFDFAEGEREYRVSMRILLKNKMSDNAACMALDIFSFIQSAENNDSRILFLFDSADNKPSKLSVYFSRSSSAHQKIKTISENELLKYKHELSQSFNIPPEHVYIHLSDELFPFEGGFGGDSYISINEEA